MKFLSIFIFFQITLLGCTGKAGHNNKVVSNELSLEQTAKDTLKFVFNYHKVIKDFKKIDFESSKHNFDKFTKQITELEYETICKKTKNKLDYTNPLKSKDFIINAEYGLVSFNSIKEGDLYNVYKYLGYNEKIGKHVIFLQTLDLPITIFLDNDSYDYFYVKGEMFLSDDESFFISTYADVDYNIIGFYKIEANGISNIINLYSDKIFINKICISSKIVFETILMNNSSFYYELDKSAFKEK